VFFLLFDALFAGFDEVSAVETFLFSLNRVYTIVKGIEANVKAQALKTGF